MRDLDLRHRTEGEAVIIEAVGELDIYTVSRLRALVTGVAGTAGVVVLDLDGVTFIDAAGLAAVVGALRRARDTGGGLIVVCTREPVLRALRSAGLLGVLDIRDTVEAALEAAGG